MCNECKVKLNEGELGIIHALKKLWFILGYNYQLKCYRWNNMNAISAPSCNSSRIFMEMASWRDDRLNILPQLISEHSLKTVEYLLSHLRQKIEIIGQTSLTKEKWILYPEEEAT